MIAFAAVLQLVSGMFPIMYSCFQNARQTFPIDSLLSAVCLKVKAIVEIGGVKETSQSCDELERGCAEVRMCSHLYT